MSTLKKKLNENRNEWRKLMEEARDLGITTGEVKRFLHKKEKIIRIKGDREYHS